MTLTKILSVLFCSGLVTIVAAQSGIGVIPTNADYALHIKTSSAAQDPLRLEGLNAGSTETSVLVTDANGSLSYRPAADLFGSSLWVNNSEDISPVSNRSVGIGQTNVDNSLILGVTGNQRMANTSQLQFGGNENFIYANSINQLYFVGRQQMSFRDRNNTTDLLTVRADNNRVGLFNNNPGTDFEVSGTQRMTADERLEFRDGTNYINSPGSNNNWYFHGQQYVVFRDRNDAVDILTVQANTDRVGILNRNPAVDFEVSGTQRMTGDNQLQFGSTSNYIYARTNQDLRIHGFTETNFMSRGESSVVMNVDANTQRVGIRTNDPDAVLHVESNASLSSVGGGVARFGDGQYVGISQNQIGAYSGSSTNPLHLQQFGNSLIIGAGNPTISLLDARGSARIGDMPTVANDNFVVTANATGDLRNITWANAQTAFGDDLGDHTATEDIDIEAEHQIQFNSPNKYIGRFDDDIDIVALDGEAHIHAENLIVTNENVEGIAYFEGATQRVGFGEENDPDATVHINPAGSDFPIRIEGIPLASSNSSIYRRLLIDNNGYVYRARNTVNRNGLTSTIPPTGSVIGSPNTVSSLNKVPGHSLEFSHVQEMNASSNSMNTIGFNPESLSNHFPPAVDTTADGMIIEQATVLAISLASAKELQAENIALKDELASNEYQQREAMQKLEAKVAELTLQINRIIGATGLDKADIKSHSKSCSHDHSASASAKASPPAEKQERAVIQLPIPHRSSGGH